MVKQELVERSPVRIFEKSIQGGLKAGEIGVIASPSGIGKTSVLVQIALDKLLQNQKIIHISFAQHNSYVLSWYENIFEEFINRKEIENLADIKDELVKNRVLMHFNQSVMKGEQILTSIKAMIKDGGFMAQSLIIDGFDFSKIDCEHLAKVKAFAQELGLSIWYSCNVQDGLSNGNIPSVLKNYLDLVEVIITLEPKQDHIMLSISKNRETIQSEPPTLRLNPQSLLILAH